MKKIQKQAYVFGTKGWQTTPPPPPKSPMGPLIYAMGVMGDFKTRYSLVYIEYKNAKSSPNGWGIWGADDLWTHTTPPPIMRCLNYDITVMDDFCTKVSPYVIGEKSTKLAYVFGVKGRKLIPAFSKITAIGPLFYAIGVMDDI